MWLTGETKHRHFSKLLLNPWHRAMVLIEAVRSAALEKR